MRVTIGRWGRRPTGRRGSRAGRSPRRAPPRSPAPAVRWRSWRCRARRAARGSRSRGRELVGRGLAERGLVGRGLAGVRRAGARPQVPPCPVIMRKRVAGPSGVAEPWSPLVCGRIGDWIGACASSSPAAAARPASTSRPTSPSRATRSPTPTSSRWGTPPSPTSGSTSPTPARPTRRSRDWRASTSSSWPSKPAYDAVVHFAAVPAILLTSDARRTRRTCSAPTTCSRPRPGSASAR